MRKQRHKAYESHPEVILGPPRPALRRVRMTPDDFASQYHRLPSCTCPEGATVVVTTGDGVFRYSVEIPPLLVHEGFRSDPIRER